MSLKCRDARAIFAGRWALAAVRADGSMVSWGDGCTRQRRYCFDASSVEDQLQAEVVAVYYHDWAGAAVKRGGRVVTWGHQRGGGDSSAVRAELDAGVITVVSTDLASGSN